MPRRLLALAAALSLTGTVTGRAAAQPGAPDATFGTGGVVVHPAVGSDVSDVLVEADGSVVAVGSVTVGNDLQGLVYRLRPDGTPDPAFGQDGTLVVRPPGAGTASLVFSSVAADGSGRLVVGGSEYRGSDQAVVVRLAGGTLDPTFGTGGVTRALPTGTFVAQVLPLPDGRLLVTGIQTHPVFRCFAARLNAAGALDPAFGAGGLTSFNAPDGAFNEDCFGAALLPDGRLAVGATAIQGPEQGSAGVVVVLTADGALDPAFGGDGVAVLPLCTGDCIPNGGGGFVVDAAGRLVLAGTLYTGAAPGWDSYVARVLPGGTPDADFGTAGVVRGVLPVRGSATTSVEDAVLQTDGGLVVVGVAEGRGPTFTLDVLLARVLGDGTLDPAFGSGGEALIDGGGFDGARAVALARGGEIVAAGSTDDDGRVSALVVRALGTAVVAAEPAPGAAALTLGVVPQPVRDVGALTLGVAAPGPVRLGLYDLLGREVARLHDGPLAAGAYTFPLPVGGLAPGLYVVRADGHGPTASLRVVVARG